MSDLKIQTWERNLLDLSMGNSLLHLRPGKTIVELSEVDVSHIIDTLKAGRLAEIVGGKTATSKDVGDNELILKELYRASRSAIEENGANNLFLSVGTLRWFDEEKAEEHLAPLLLIPLNIVRTKAKTYEIRLRDEESMFNFTLLEYMRQTFGIDLREFVSVETDDTGIPDWKPLFAKFGEHVEAINAHQPDDKKWTMPLKSYVGLFSFTKFLMWNDIHTSHDIIGRHPLLKGLIENRIPQIDRCIKTASSAESDSPATHMLPLAYDSSQLEAVMAATSGESFVLHGPPGTGKSQTITNIIADALFNGKKVLFVAEKRAALDVVNKRLAAIGLSPYCLELHSNKTNKKSFFAQLSNSNIDLIQRVHEQQGGSENYTQKSNILFSQRYAIKDFTDAMHAKRDNGLSLFDIISRYESAPGMLIDLPYESISHLTPSDVDTICETLAKLDKAMSIFGSHIAESPLRGVYPLENTADNENALLQVLSELPVELERIKKKQSRWLNRYIFKKDLQYFLSKNRAWIGLTELAEIESDIKNEDNIERLIEYADKWEKSLKQLRKWYYVSTCIIESGILSLSSSTVLDYLYAGHSGIETSEAFKKSYYRDLAENIIGQDQALRGFNGAIFQLKLKNYRHEAHHFHEVSARYLQEVLLDRARSYSLPKEYEKEWLLLSRRQANGGRGVSLRKIISESSHVLSELFPCMLMSPISVAQYLDMSDAFFDIVVFDEASQMSTADAIGAIARSKTVVVVGDPKQLPPTRFFMNTTISVDDDADSEDADSVLEDFIALGIPSRYLSRHYRSRHESLIAFSNREFYDNKLMTFPSVNDRDKKVWLIDPEGVYDYGESRTNDIEAKAVVNKIVEILDGDGDTLPSIGVVTFSRPQADLIEDLLMNKLARNKKMAERAEKALEPIFVKNLENVQGDERDIILFSIGYGPDRNGKVSLNFGPLNRQGGERRLNVAASRAREEMYVFSSLKARHIVSDNPLSKGAEALRDFLEYAESGSVLSGEVQCSKDFVINKIAEALENRGLKVETGVGRSDFKVDIAIIDMEHGGSYKSGIIVDGENYASMPTVRDREITSIDILHSLGWHIQRVYVLDWFDNPELVIDEIMESL
ncbi:MAG: DUF4011 domain-containing protein [Muribaculaceae bacterium]|nr:DUF4011 domain-containing protein [Muribaculaceae bacterium]